MFDSLTAARQLTEAGIDRTHADAMANVIRQATEHGDHVTPAQLDAGLDTLRADLTAEINAVRAELTAELNTVRAEVNTVRAEVNTVRTELTAELNTLRAELTAEIASKLAATESRQTWRFAGAMIAQTAATVAAVVTVLRLLG